MITERISIWSRGRGSARYLLNKHLKRGIQSLPYDLRRALEITVCRLLFDERVPKPLIVSSAVDEIRRQYGESLSRVANAVLRKIYSSPANWPDRELNPVDYFAVSTSHPHWIVQRWLTRWGEERTELQLLWDNRRPDIWLRWNRLKGDANKAKATLDSADIEFQTNSAFSGFFRILGSFYPQGASLVQSGYFSVQDPSASLAVRLLDPKPGKRILDLCAAPGGKTTLIAELTDDAAQIIAVDFSKDRLRRVTESLQRLGISCVQMVHSDGVTYVADYQKAKKSPLFDAVLLDVPCSGLGVLNRRVDLRWRRKPEDLEDLVKLQRELIRAAGKCIKTGGIIVYSTCTTEPEENEEIIRGFIAERPEFEFDDRAVDIPPIFFRGKGEIVTDSPRDSVDGIYAARLIRRS